MRATKPLEITHSNVCGPMRTTSLGGARYFVTYIDDLSRKVWVYLLKSKGECLEKFKEFKALVETQSEHKMKVFQSDNGGEYISKGFERFLRAHGIEKQTSTPYRPQQNEVAERANRTLVEHACSKPQEVTLGRSGGECSLHKKSMSIKSVAIHHTRGSVEWEKALHFTHACVLMHCVCHGVG